MQGVDWQEIASRVPRLGEAVPSGHVALTATCDLGIWRPLLLPGHRFRAAQAAG